jgi:hypothetical protein
MHSLAVWDNKGHQYLPIFDRNWEHVEMYAPALEAEEININNWLSKLVFGDNHVE